MSVRAKFTVDSIESTIGQVYDQETKVYKFREMKTIKLSPKYSDDPNSENKKFWDATPGGQLSLNCVNPEASEYFVLGQDYYLDFTKAEKQESAAG